jgi:ligand-binding SRPBCC domain-containing protein
MAVHSLKTVQKIPATANQAWDFFSSLAKLQVITPAKMSFRIISKHHGDKVYAGQIIEYKVKPILGIPLYWMTVITHVEDKKLFIDEQRKGPFSMWHHQHHFKEIDGGVEMTDIVHYKNPLWILGSLANSIWVRGQLKELFTYRFNKVEELFGKWPGQEMKIELI